MCWNAEVSLNTFVFSTFVLGMIIYNNAYTQYKIQYTTIGLNNFQVYLFFFSFILMQLFEFFIWRNINNKYYNSIFTTGAFLLVCLQPIFSLMLLPNIFIRNLLLAVYCISSVSYVLLNLPKSSMYSSVVGKNGHLRWSFIDINIIPRSIWLFFFLFSFGYYAVVYKFIYPFIFAIVALGISYYNYLEENSVGSMWCWMVNSIFIYYAAVLLIYLPFCENKTVC